MTAKELVKRLEHYDSDPGRLAYLRERVHSVENDECIVRIAELFDSDSYRIQAVQLLANECRSPDKAVAILKIFDSDSYRAEAVKALVHALSSSLTSSLTKVSETFDSDSYRITGCRHVIMTGTASLRSDDIISAIQSFDSDSYRIQLVRCLRFNGHFLPDSILDFFDTDSYRTQTAECISHTDVIPSKPTECGIDQMYDDHEDCVITRTVPGVSTWSFAPKVTPSNTVMQTGCPSEVHAAITPAFDSIKPSASSPPLPITTTTSEIAIAFESIKLPTPAPSTTTTSTTTTTAPVVNMCKICMEAPVDTVCTPCGHMCTCLSCGNRIMERTHSCPVCRADIEKLVHVYIP